MNAAAFMLRVLIATLAAVLMLMLVAWPVKAAETHVPAKVLSVIDGDTLKVEAAIWPQQTIATAIRLRGVDSPEIHGKCAAETALAIKARDALAALVGKTVMLVDPASDKYGGRYLARVLTSDGRDVGAELIARKLARKYEGVGPRGSWCP